LPADAASTPNARLYKVACPSITECVAIGSYSDASGGTDGLLLTRSGGSWTATEAPLPTGGNDTYLTGLSCPSAAECSVVGSYDDSNGNQNGLLLTFLGGSWAAEEAPPPPNPASDPKVELLTVSCASTTVCVATGSYQPSSGGTDGLLLTLSGGSWTADGVPLPANVASSATTSVGNAVCPSTTECLAAGGYFNKATGNGGQLGLTWSGGSWTATKVSMPASVIGAGTIYGMTCASATVCIAFGMYYSSPGITPGFLLTWSSGSWKTAAAPVPSNDGVGNSAIIEDMTCPSATVCVAVGAYSNDSPGGSYGLLLKWSSGSWKATEAPSPDYTDVVVFAVSCPSVSQCFAGGFYIHDQRLYGLMLTGQT
jgi:hypothetical protein